MSPVPQRKTDGGFDEKKFNEIQMAGFDGFGGFGGVGYFYFVLWTDFEPVRFRRAGDGGGDINPWGADSHHDGYAHALAGNRNYLDDPPNSHRSDFLVGDSLRERGVCGGEWQQFGSGGGFI